MRRAAIFAGIIVLASCESAPYTSSTTHPFVGCWESESGQSTEGWTIDPSGWLVGYAINRDADNKVTFFESMRIERGEGVDVFVATGADGATTRFTREDAGDASVYQFVNPDHDFPQVISYQAGAGRLDAYISLADGSNRIEFLKATCATD